MKQPDTFLAYCWLALTLGGASTVDIAAQVKGIEFHISPRGNDNWSGLRAEPNRARTDGPFATFHRAAAAVRALNQTGRFPDGGVHISVRAGTYEFSGTLQLDAEDCGVKDGPVIWRAHSGGRVHIVGAKRIRGFRRINEEFVRRRLDADARNKILVTDLSRQGISDFGGVTPRGGPGMELFVRDRRMTLARWPNTDWLLIADVPQSGEKLLHEGLEREKRYDGVPVGRHYGRIAYNGDRPRRWSPKNDIYMHGYWTWDWSDSYQRVQSIDTSKREITLAEPHHHYGYTKKQRFYFANVLEELDVPGEWYLDRESGLLYFWPPAGFADGDASVSLLDDPLVSIDNTRFVQFHGFTFERSRGNGIVITGGSDNIVLGCTFRLLGNEAITITGGSRHQVKSCDIFDVALGGIRLSGGDRRSLTPAHHSAINNHIHHYSTWIRTGQYAIMVDGVGNLVQHNLIHDAPHQGIYLRGNDHVLEFNDISRVCLETGDAGAIYTGRDWTWRGNVIRYNYFHDLQGPGLHGVMAVYLDDWASGFTIYGNIFYRSGRSAFIGGGRDNVVENNVFVECQPSVHIDARGLGWAGYYFDGTRPELFEHLKEMKYHEPPYSTRYPELLSLDDGEPAVPKNNRIIRNVSYGGRWMDIYDYDAFDFSVVTIRDNVVADPDLCRRRQKGQGGWDPYYLDIDRKDGYVLYKMGDPEMLEEFKQNVFLQADPGFMNFAAEDFRLKLDSPAYKLGFKPIPIEKIGLFTDEQRRALPKRDQ